MFQKRVRRQVFPLSFITIAGVLFVPGVGAQTPARTTGNHVGDLSAELMLHGMERGLLQKSFDHGSLRKGSVLYNAFQEPARERRA